MRRLLRFTPFLVVVAAALGAVLFIVQPWEQEDDPFLRGAEAEDITYRLCNLLVPPLTDGPMYQRSPEKEGLKLHPARRNDEMGLRLMSVDLGVVYKVPSGETVAPNGIRSYATVDSVTGELVDTRYANAQDRALIERVLEGVRLEPIDPATAPWPYTSDRPASLQLEEKGLFTYLRPGPASGLMVEEVSDDIFLINNCRSEMWLEVAPGAAGPGLAVDEESTKIHPDDETAFQRFFDEVEKRSGLEQ